MLRVLAIAIVLAFLAGCRDEPVPPATDANGDIHAGAADAPRDPSGQQPADVAIEPLPGEISNTTPVDTLIVDIQLSDQSDGTVLTGRRTDQFAPADVVYLSVRSEGTATAYTVSSKWLAPDGTTLTEYSHDIAAAGPVDTLFSLSKPDGWAPGQYQVELSINGKPLRSVPFTVR